MNRDMALKIMWALVGLLFGYSCAMRQPALDCESSASNMRLRA